MLLATLILLSLAEEDLRDELRTSNLRTGISPFCELLCAVRGRASPQSQTYDEVVVYSLWMNRLKDVQNIVISRHCFSSRRLEFKRPGSARRRVTPGRTSLPHVSFFSALGRGGD